MEVLEYEYLPDFEGSIVLARGDNPMGLRKQAVGENPLHAARVVRVPHGVGGDWWCGLLSAFVASFNLITFMLLGSH